MVFHAAKMLNPALQLTSRPLKIGAYFLGPKREDIFAPFATILALEVPPYEW